MWVLKGVMMKSILDRSFRYTPSFKTDLAVKFAHVRKELGKRDMMPALHNAKIASNQSAAVGAKLLSGKTI